MEQPKREVSFNNDKPRDISIADPVAGSIITVIFLILLHTLFEYFGVWRVENGISEVIPFVESDYARYFVTFVTLLLIISLIKSIFKFVHQRWTITMFFISAVLSVVSIIILYNMHENRALWNENFMDGLVDAGFYESTTSFMYQATETAWYLVSEWLFIVLIIFYVAGILIDGYRTLQRARKEPVKKEKRASIE